MNKNLERFIPIFNTWKGQVDKVMLDNNIDSIVAEHEFYSHLAFIYDTIKIMVLLGALILIISYIQSSSPGEAKKDARKISQDIGKHTCLPTRDGDSVLFLLVHLLSIGFTGAGLPLCVTSSFLISSPMVNSRKALLASCG